MAGLGTNTDTSTHADTDGEDSEDGVRTLYLALEVDGAGAHPAAWLAAGRPPTAALIPQAVRAVVATAQDAGFALATFADGPPTAETGSGSAPRLEAGTRAAFVSAVTDRIGLAPTLHATTTEPFHLATQLAALDHAGHGRAAWVVGAANSAAERATIGAQPLAPDALRRETIDVVGAARALWDSWEDDAVIKDAATGRYLDSGKVHHIDFEGAAFTVKGPLITPRPPQGQIVVIAPDFLEIDEHADIVLIRQPDVGAIDERARRARQAGAALVFADLEIVLDADESSAARLARLAESSPWPDSGAPRYAGSAAGLVDVLRGLAQVVDGVRLLPAVLSVDLPILVEQVLPALSAADVEYRAPRPGDTLRATLGLTRPTNRFAHAANPSR
jgi:alkanesulfonate monooxygenase SsuD/methylene tetrahydromethanopterin reductase-like flavin-dependent oxidoreductase (luciferase family)